MSYASLDEAMLYGYGIERSFLCHVHGDSTPSASVNSVSGLWFCYACGARGKYNVSEIPVSDAAVQMTKFLDSLKTEGRMYTESYLDVFDSLGPGQYWLSRFSEEICRIHRLGQTGAVATYPVRDPSGDLLGITRRDLTGQDRAKYRYPGGVYMSGLLYNYHRSTGDVLMLTEGATDAIAAEEAGWKDVMATYRNGVSAAQVELIRKYAPSVVLIGYDQDDAGESGYKQAHFVLSPFVRVDRMTWTDYKDLAAVPLEQRRELVNFFVDNYG